MAAFDWLGDFITETWDSITPGDVAKSLIGVGSALRSGDKKSSSSGIVSRGANVGSYINTSNPSPLKQSTPAPIAGLNEGYKPIFNAKNDDPWNYMFRRVLSENSK